MILSKMEKVYGSNDYLVLKVLGHRLGEAKRESTFLKISSNEAPMGNTRTHPEHDS